jgi:hypothetical protein
VTLGEIIEDVYARTQDIGGIGRWRVVSAILEEYRWLHQGLLTDRGLPEACISETFTWPAGESKVVLTDRLTYFKGPIDSITSASYPEWRFVSRPTLLDRRAMTNPSIYYEDGLAYTLWGSTLMVVSGLAAIDVTVQHYFQVPTADRISEDEENDAYPPFGAHRSDEPLFPVGWHDVLSIGAEKRVRAHVRAQAKTKWERQTPTQEEKEVLREYERKKVALKDALAPPASYSPRLALGPYGDSLRRANSRIRRR